MTNPAFEISSSLFSFPLPKEAKILVSEGDEVLKGKVLATEEVEEFEEFDLAGFFSISPKKVSKILSISPGAKIEKGQIVAIKKGLFGKGTIFKSPVAGVFVGLSDKGILKIKTKSEKKELLSPFSGKINKVCCSAIKEKKGNLLVLEFEGEKIEGGWGRGGKVFGILDVLGERDEEVKLSQLRPEDKGKILVAGGKISLGICHKAEALGIAGLVGGSISPEAEANELTIVSLGGNDGSVPKEIWQELEKRKGKEALLSGEEKFLFFPKNLQ